MSPLRRFTRQHWPPMAAGAVTFGLCGSMFMNELITAVGFLTFTSVVLAASNIQFAEWWHGHE